MKNSIAHRIIRACGGAGAVGCIRIAGFLGTADFTRRDLQSRWPRADANAVTRFGGAHIAIA
jgi:hypothetical protein